MCLLIFVLEPLHQAQQYGLRRVSDGVGKMVMNNGYCRQLLINEVLRTRNKVLNRNWAQDSSFGDDDDRVSFVCCLLFVYRLVSFPTDPMRRSPHRT